MGAAATKAMTEATPHFEKMEASVLKDVKDRGGWNTASALVGFKQRPLL